MNKLSFSILFTGTIVLLYLLNFIFADGFNGGADTISHFHISKYSWVYPALFMDQWGKPVFNILMSPFANMGFKAVAFVNVLLIFINAIIAYRIAQRLNIRNPHWVVWLYLLTPIVIGNSYSSLTEPICSLFLSGFIYLAIKEKWVLASLCLSFMPFARSEGFVIVLLVVIFFVFTKRFRYIPFLLVGTFIFNSIGFAMTGLPMWIFQANPYIHTDITVYGSGTFYHFFMAAIPIFGFVFILLVMHSFRLIKHIKILFKSASWQLNDQIWFWIILGSFWGYFLAHVVLWWFGMWASLGLLRVMFVICVPAALLIIKEIELLENRYSSFKSQNFKAVFWIHILALPFIIRLFTLQEIEIFPPKGVEEKTVDEFITKFKEVEVWDTCKLYTGHPYILFKLEKDPFDTMKSANLWDWKKAKKGDLIVWDGHFGPNEHKVPLKAIDSDRSFKLLLNVEPEIEFYTLNNSKFCVRLYQKQ
jgi:hypothetical protein